MIWVDGKPERRLRITHTHNWETSLSLPDVGLAGWLIHLMQMVFSCSLIHIKPALPITKSSFTLSVFECDWWQYGKFAFCEIRYGFECKWESCTARCVLCCCRCCSKCLKQYTWMGFQLHCSNVEDDMIRMCVCVLYTMISWECNAALVDHITHCIDVNVWRIRMQVNIF